MSSGCRHTLLSSDGDDHPPPTGNRKATEEFVPLLNVHYNKWSATAPKTAPVSEPPDDHGGTAKVEPPPTVEAPPQAEPKATSTARQLIDDFEQESRLDGIPRQRKEYPSHVRQG